MIIIKRSSDDEARPYANLLPIVETLVASGNVLLDDGFVLNQGGWQCRLSIPIRWDLVKNNFVLPSTVDISEDHDSILDRLSWCVIEGPGARAARRQ